MVSIQHGIMGALCYVETNPEHMLRDVSLGSIGVGLVFPSERLNWWANILNAAVNPIVDLKTIFQSL